MPENRLAIRWMALLDGPMRQSTLMGDALSGEDCPLCLGLPNYSDWDFVMRLARQAEVRNLPEVLVQYRRHETNLTRLFTERLDKVGIDIALGEIGTEVPGFEISGEEVCEIPAVLFGRHHSGKKMAGRGRTRRGTVSGFGTRISSAAWMYVTRSGPERLF